MHYLHYLFLLLIIASSCSFNRVATNTAVVVVDISNYAWTHLESTTAAARTGSTEHVMSDTSTWRRVIEASLDGSHEILQVLKLQVIFLLELRLLVSALLKKERLLILSSILFLFFLLNIFL